MVERTREARINNLRKHGFQPGQSGNPKGRPKGVSFAALAKKLLTQETDFEMPNGEKVRITREEALVLRAILIGELGREDFALKAIQMIYDRLEGKPPTQGQEQGSEQSEGGVFAALPTERKAEILRLMGIKAVQEIDITPHEELDTDADE